jgi:hypothetical protein
VEAFKAWNGYILGMTLEMEPYVRSLQSWGTSEFPEGCSDSRVEQRRWNGADLYPTEIPDGQGESYQQDWQDFYFKPMRAYFTR